MHNQSPNAFIPKEDFSALSPKARRIWSKMPPETKAIILRRRTGSCNDCANNHSKNIYKTIKPPSYPPKKFSAAHLYYILTELISESSFSEQNEVDATKDDPDLESTLLVNSTFASMASPGDIRKIMYTPYKSKATYNNKQTAFSRDISLNGKNYRE